MELESARNEPIQWNIPFSDLTEGDATPFFAAAQYQAQKAKVKAAAAKVTQMQEAERQACSWAETARAAAAAAGNESGGGVDEPDGGVEDAISFSKAVVEAMKSDDAAAFTAAFDLPDADLELKVSVQRSTSYSDGCGDEHWVKYYFGDASLHSGFTRDGPMYGDRSDFDTFDPEADRKAVGYTEIDDIVDIVLKNKFRRPKCAAALLEVRTLSEKQLLRLGAEDGAGEEIPKRTESQQVASQMGIACSDARQLLDMGVL